MRHSQQGFTLVEIMIVVAIIGLLVAVAFPSFLTARKHSQNARYMNDLRVISASFEQFAAEYGAYPPDSQPGVEPTGMANYFTKVKFTSPTPLGGQWDWDLDYQVKAAVSVVGPFADDSQIKEVDAKLDDGTLATGNFRYTGGRLSLILER